MNPFLVRHLSRARFAVAGLAAAIVLTALSAPIIQTLLGFPAGESIYAAFAAICHQYPSRSFWVADRPAALCVRCCGGYFGMALAGVVSGLSRRLTLRLQIGVGFAMIAGALIDPLVQISTQTTSVWEFRFGSGVLGGFGVSSVLFPALSTRNIPSGRKTMTRKKFVFHGILFGIIASISVAPPAGARDAAAVRIRNGTVVPVKTQEQLSGRKLKAGQEVIFVVSVPVSVDGIVVIPAGTPVNGFVQDASGSQMAGVAGELTIALRSTTAIDGTTIPLSGQFIAKGDDQIGRNVAVGVILCPFILLDKGGEGVIPAGAEIRGMTIGDYDIRVGQPQGSRPLWNRIQAYLGIAVGS